MPTKQHYVDKATEDYGDPLAGFIRSVASDWSMKTTQGRYHDTKDYFNYLVDKDILPGDDEFQKTSTVKGYLDHCKTEKGLSDGTVHNRYKSLKKFYDHYLMDEDDPTAHPFKDSRGDTTVLLEPAQYRSKKTQRQKENGQGDDIPRLTDDQISQLLDNVPTPRVRNKLIINLLAETGIRRSELINIKLDDLNWKDDTDRVLDIRHGKGSKGSGPRFRTVLYPSKLNLMLRQYIEGGYRDESPHAEDSPYLFPSRDGEQLSIYSVGYACREAAKNAGITEPSWIDASGREHGPVHPHIFRHTFIFNKLEQGMPPRLLMEFTGHNDIDLILRYSEMNRAEVIRQGMKHIP